MFELSSGRRYFLYRSWCDMRKSFDGLSGLVRNGLGLDPASGDVYVFINRRRDRLKLLVWQGDGYALYYKRLEIGTFEYPRQSCGGDIHVLNWTELVLIMQGIALESVRHRKRYSQK